MIGKYAMNAFTLALSIVVQCVAGSPIIYEKKLLQNLTSDYGDVAVRPVTDSSESIDVRFRLLIQQVIKFDEPLQQLIIDGWLKMEWTDVFLQWDPSVWGNVSILSIFPDKIWKPDIVFHENVDEKWESVKNIEAVLTPEGTVTWYTPIILQISCKVKVRYFPFDYQNCNVTMSSWRYDRSGLNMIPFDDADAKQNVFDENGIWSLTKVFTSTSEEKYNCCVEPYTNVIVHISLVRKPGYYIYNVIAPCMLLSTMTVFVFRLPPESGEKISLGMTNVVALILFQQLIAENMPPLGDEMPILGVYFIAMIIMGCISVMTTVVILRVYHYPETRPVPRWIRYLIGQRSKENKKTTISKVFNSSYMLAGTNGFHNGFLQSEKDHYGDKNGEDHDKEENTAPLWRQFAVLLDKTIFAALILGMVAVLLYVIMQYVIYFQTLKNNDQI